MFYLGLTIVIFISLVLGLFLILKKKFKKLEKDLGEKASAIQKIISARFQVLNNKFDKIKEIAREELDEDIKETKNFFNNKK